MTSVISNSPSRHHHVHSPAFRSPPRPCLLSLPKYSTPPSQANMPRLFGSPAPTHIASSQRQSPHALGSPALATSTPSPHARSFNTNGNVVRIASSQGDPFVAAHSSCTTMHPELAVNGKRMSEFTKRTAEDSESDFRNPRAEISCLNNHWSARGSPASSPQAGARHFTSERRHLSSSTNQLLPKMSLAEAFIQLSASTSYLSRSSDLWTSMNGSTSSNGCKLKQDPAVAARTALTRECRNEIVRLNRACKLPTIERFLHAEYFPYVINGQYAWENWMSERGMEVMKAIVILARQGGAAEWTTTHCALGERYPRSHKYRRVPHGMFRKRLMYQMTRKETDFADESDLRALESEVALLRAASIPLPEESTS